MEYSFSFWQNGRSCDEIPSDSASMEEVVSYFLSVNSLYYYSDQWLGSNSGKSFNYQVATELGYYGYETKKFKHLLLELPTDKNPMCIFLSPEIPQEFNGTLLKDLSIWLENHGDKFIHLYGDLDPWAATAVPESDKVDSEWFMMKGKHHSSAKISEMTAEERERVILTLEKWLSIEIE